MVEPTELPLRDIHLPPPVSWWPPAPGWWVLGAAVVVLLIVGALAYRWWRRTRLRRRARARLAEIARTFATHQDRHRLARELSMLCRQVALQLYGADTAAATVGSAWLAQLDATSRERFFSTGAGRVLVDAPYNPAAPFEAGALLSGLEQWLRRLPLSRPAVPRV